MYVSPEHLRSGVAGRDGRGREWVVPRKLVDGSPGPSSWVDVLRVRAGPRKSSLSKCLSEELETGRRGFTAPRTVESY